MFCCLPQLTEDNIQTNTKTDAISFFMSSHPFVGFCFIKLIIPRSELIRNNAGPTKKRSRPDRKVRTAAAL